jgi:uncharacterized protein (TIGR00369 family)
MTDDPYATILDRATSSPLGRHLGWTCRTMSEDVAVFELPFSPHNTTVGAMVHGGAIAALADAAATAASWAKLDLEPTLRGSTLGFSINYLEPAVETSLTATARVVRRGRSVVVVGVDVHDSRDKRVAQASVTYKFTRPR